MTLSTIKTTILTTLLLITLTAGHSVCAEAKHNKQYWQESTCKDLHIPVVSKTKMPPYFFVS